MNDKRSIDVGPIDEARLETAVEVLAKGFFEDPFAIYMIPDANDRSKSLTVHFATVLRLGVLYGEVYTTSDPPAGAAIWFGPDLWELTVEQLEKAGALELPGKLPQGAFARFQAVTEFCERLHRRNIQGPHWYLAVPCCSRG
jgi:hypothetical protein